MRIQDGEELLQFILRINFNYEGGATACLNASLERQTDRRACAGAPEPLRERRHPAASGAPPWPKHAS
ncbi:hypothetical protein RVS24_26610, partial [Escherichia coli]|nr:hypothetical protein [Escherichia coli]